MMSLKLNDISLSSSTLKAGDRKSWKWPNGCDIVAMVTRTWTFFFFGTRKQSARLQGRVGHLHQQLSHLCCTK